MVFNKAQGLGPRLPNLNSHYRSLQIMLYVIVLTSRKARYSTGFTVCYQRAVKPVIQQASRLVRARPTQFQTNEVVLQRHYSSSSQKCD